MRGILMAPNNGNGPPPRRKPPTDGELPAVPPGSGVGGGGSGDGIDPPIQQVVLAKGTFLKFAITIGGTVLIGISAVLGFYWSHHYKTVAHMSDGTIHLKSGERATLETKAEAQKHRAKLVKEVKREVEYQHRIIKVRQDEEIKQGLKKLTQDLRHEQRAEFRKLLQEVQKTRRAVRAAPAHSSPP